MTRLDVIQRALRAIGVLAYDETATADMQDQAGVVLDGIFAELQDKATVAWTLADVPSVVGNYLSSLLAAYVSTDYDARPPVSRARAWAEILAVVRPDDRAEVASQDDYGYQ